MPVLGIDPSIFSPILPGEQCTGERRDALPLPRVLGGCGARQQPDRAAFSGTVSLLSGQAPGSLIPTRQARSGPPRPSSTNDKVKGMEGSLRSGQPTFASPWCNPAAFWTFVQKTV